MLKQLKNNITQKMKECQARNPVQKRGKETKVKILSSASKLFEKIGYDKSTSANIAKKAGVSVGSFYAYFGDKEAVLLELFDDHAHRLLKMMRDPISKLEFNHEDPQENIKVILKMAAKIHLLNPKLHKTFLEVGMRNDKLKKLWKEWDHIAVLTTQTFLEQVKQHLKITDTYLSAYIIYHMVDSLLYRNLIHDDGPDVDKMVNELSILIYSYLVSQSLQYKAQNN